MSQLVQLLDRVDPARYDASEILDRLNEFGRLELDEQDAEELGIWGYSGLEDAQHPLLDLCAEAHNDFCVVRDLDGALLFLWETAPGSGEWEAGPLYRQHISYLELERYTEREDSPAEHGVRLTRTELLQLLDGLPADPPGRSQASRRRRR